MIGTMYKKTKIKQLYKYICSFAIMLVFYWRI
jgi:hypothetical protein